jgi:hypothetical protein
VPSFLDGVVNLTNLLALELERTEENLIEPNRTYEIWSPDRAFVAAETLLQALEADKAQR